VRAFREDPQTHEYAEVPDEHGFGLSIIRDRTGETEAAFIAAVTHAVDALKGADGIWSWALLNEPWAWPKTDWKRERFIGLIEKLAAAVHERDPRPVTVRFVNAKVWDDAQGARRVTDLFYDDFRSDPRLFAALDFVSFNCYDGFPHETPDEQRVRQEVLDILARHVALCREHGKDVWVTEFGLDTDDDALQAQYAREMLAEFQRLGIKGCLWWAWHGDWGGRDVKGSACGSYNLVADPLTGRPRPAYEALANAQP
jgi:hypothetical protein